MSARIDLIKKRHRALEYYVGKSVAVIELDQIYADMEWLLVNLQGAKTALEAIARCNDNKFLESGLLAHQEMAQLCLDNLNEGE